MEQNYQYTVCIHCMTYNHEKYLADALEGFVMQKTNFPFVAVVIDDFSTDGTADVLRKYETKYPDIIKAVYLQENYYSQRKSKNPFLEPYDSQAKYIALCEGDDYWIDSYKLQKQVDFMDSHPECVMHCLNAYQDIEGYRQLFVDANRHTSYLTLSQMLEKWCVPTASILYRRDVMMKVNSSKSYLNGDYALELRLMSQGKIYYDSLVTSIYRMHGDSVSADMNRHKVKSWQDLIELLVDMKELYPVGQHYLFDEAITHYVVMIKDHIRSTHPVKKWFYRKTYTRAIKRWLRKIK